MDRRAGADAREAPLPRKVTYCDLCAAPMLDLHCKLSCKNCGYKRDCSDP